MAKKKKDNHTIGSGYRFLNHEIETPQLLAASDPALHNDGPVDGNDEMW